MYISLNEMQIKSQTKVFDENLLKNTVHRIILSSHHK